MPNPTAQTAQTAQTAAQTDPMHHRAAMRSLLDARTGELCVLDHTTGRAMSRPVRYEATHDGSFTAYISDCEDLTEVIDNGGAVSLDISRGGTLAVPVVSAAGVPASLTHITAHVDAEVLDSATARLGRISQSLARLRLRVRNLSITMQQPAVA